MTNHWIDIANSDCVLIMGSNPAENHPIAFRWIQKAADRGAKVIHVDPRYTRTSALADLYIPIRPGADIAFLGGLINYIIKNNKYFKKYLVNYTNAPFLLQSSYGFSDGLFSGFDQERRRYDKSQWDFVRDEQGVPAKDPSLTDPNCVFRKLKEHYARYTPEQVCRVTGIDRDDLSRIYGVYSSAGGPGKTATIMYAMGWTQHTVGVQNIRAMAIVQLLLGNMGRPGGGVNALRGESNVQGSTDHCLLWHIWPGYLKTPRAGDADLASYNQRCTPTTGNPQSANWWSNYPKYSVSLLKAVFGAAAKPENDFGFAWLPKVDEATDYGWLSLFDRMYHGLFKGFFAWGQNPACSGANADKNRQALAKLDWLVTVNLFDNETSSFWQGPGQDSAKIKTEVFLLPCAASLEKEGSVTNSGRWSQWRYQAVSPPGRARGDGEIILDLWARLARRYAKGGVHPAPVVNFLKGRSLRRGYDPHRAAKLINGYFEKDVTVKGRTFKAGTLVPSFAYLQADGSTCSGNWLYCNSYTEAGNMAARRSAEDPTGMGLLPKWAWSWPVNRRIIYNRAGVDLTGRPWSPDKNILEWDGQKWRGDVPDGGWPPLTAGKKSRLPFIMKPDGVASVFGPGRADGPLPEHYEPVESPLDSQPFSSQLVNPVLIAYASRADRWADHDPKYPLAATTYRVAEHWQSGVMTRWQPWLLETMPHLFVEISHELAKRRGIRNGQLCRVVSARGAVEAAAVVTNRLKPLKIMDRMVDVVGLPWCYGWIQPKGGGDSANLLTPAAADPNTGIPETKAFMVNIEIID